MRWKIALGLLLVAQLAEPAAKKPPAPKVDVCTAGHDCHCRRKTHDLQDAYINKCYTESKDRKALLECLRNTPDHCSLVNRYDLNEMAGICGKACKRHSCKCDDGPPCSVGIGYESGELP